MEFSNDDLEEFRQESDDLLNEAEAALLNLEQGATLKDHYDAIFRSFHSLKGAAGMLGLDELQKHVHQLEHIFQSIKGQEKLDSQACDFFLRGVNATQKILHGTSVSFDYNFPTSATPQDVSPQITEAPPLATAKDLTRPDTENLSPLVFVVDDEPDILDILESQISDAGYRAQTFTSAIDALEAYQKLSPPQRPWIILSDFKMPKMNGLEFLEKFRSLNSEIPFLFLSAFLTRENLIKAVQLGVAAVLDKPIRTEMLLPALRQSVEKARMQNLLRSSINLLLFQYNDVEKYLLSQGKNEIAASLKREMEEILKARRNLRAL